MKNLDRRQMFIDIQTAVDDGKTVSFKYNDTVIDITGADIAFSKGDKVDYLQVIDGDTTKFFNFNMIEVITIEKDES